VEFFNILIIQTAFLGDVVLITPLIRASKALFPQAKIDVLVIPQTREVLANNPFIENILTFDKRKNKLFSLAKTIGQLRSNKYDLAISPHSSVTTASIMLLSGIKQRLGFDRGLAAKFLTFKVPHLSNGHKIQKNLFLLSAFGERQFSQQTELYPDGSAEAKLDQILASLPFNNRPLIAVSPGSAWATKRWPLSHYAHLSRLLYDKKYNLIFTGSAQEHLLCHDIILKSGAEALNFAGSLSILETAAVIKKCNLMICNDSGALHLANAMQTDVFAFFGPTVRSFGYFPFRKNDHIFETELSCRPCGSHGGKTCPLGHFKCMTEIKAETVFEAVVRKLK